MEWNNLEVPTPFVVAGYAITGSVLSENEPVPNVDFYLFSETISSAGCTLPTTVSASVKGKGKLLCVAKSSAKGEFRFASIPSGDYTLVPVYQGEQATYDVAPEVLSVHVEHVDVALDQPFRVVGFGVSGRVVAGGQGIEGAKGKLFSFFFF